MVQMMWSSWNHTSGSGYAVMALVMIAVVALVVWAVVAFRRSDSPHADSAGFTGPGETPVAGAERILAERFARGEIDADEYHRHLADLNQQLLAGPSS
jgi:putative membrane protein